MYISGIKVEIRVYRFEHGSFASANAFSHMQVHCHCQHIESESNEPLHLVTQWTPYITVYD